MFKNPIYLVPFDFTPVSENALELSLELARANGGGIFLLHVVKNKKDKARARQKFTNLINSLTVPDQKLITANVVVGSLYDDVAKASELLRPALVVIGTHGAKGMQKIFGSHIERLISNSSAPFLVTRGDKKIDEVKRIVMPFNFTKESLQITTFAGTMAKKFDACIHLVGDHDNRELHEEKIKANQIIVERFMNDNGVRFKIVDLPREKAFGKELMDYVGEVHADIIAAAYSNVNFLPTSNSSMQDIIENIYKIPVLTINSEELSSSYY